VAPLTSIHVFGLPHPYDFPYEPASFVGFSINHLGVLPVYHMVLIANMICDADLLQILAALVYSALVNIPVMLSASLRCSVSPVSNGLPVSPT